MTVYQPPNVAGWHGDAAWVGSDAWLMRLNVADSYSWRNGQGALNPDPTINLNSQLDGVLSAATAATYSGLAWAGHRWQVLLGCPEFMHK